MASGTYSYLAAIIVVISIDRHVAADHQLTPGEHQGLAFDEAGEVDGVGGSGGLGLSHCLAQAEHAAIWSDRIRVLQTVSVAISSTASWSRCGGCIAGYRDLATRGELATGGRAGGQGGPVP